MINTNANKRQRKTTAFFVIWFSIILAITLAILPLPIWSKWIQPQWIVLVLIYWGIAAPIRFGIGGAWVIGILLDVLYNTPFGEHSLILVLIMYFISKFNSRIAQLSFWQMLFLVFGLTMLYQLFPIVSQILDGKYFELWECLSRALISALIWPILAALLQSLQRKFNFEYTL